MPSNFTDNYQLSQWERSDQVRMEDFNTDNAKIDEALKAGADAQAALQAALNRKGNCSIGTFTYTGNGKYGPDNPTVVRFPRRPAAFLIVGRGMMIGQGGAAQASIIYSSGYTYVEPCSTVWSGSTLSFTKGDSAQAQLNISDVAYYVIYFCAES